MSFTDGIQAGLYVLGFLLPIAAVALVVAAVVLLDVPHRVRVLKLRREVRRSGRDLDGINLGPRRACHCANLPPGHRDLTGHEPRCPMHPSTEDYVRRANA